MNGILAVALAVTSGCFILALGWIIKARPLRAAFPSEMLPNPVREDLAVEVAQLKQQLKVEQDKVLNFRVSNKELSDLMIKAEKERDQLQLAWNQRLLADQQAEQMRARPNSWPRKPSPRRRSSRTALQSAREPFAAPTAVC